MHTNPDAKKNHEIVEKPSGVAAVDRALLVLSAFKMSPEGLTLAELAIKTELYESTILRLLASLLRAGFVKKLNDGRYVVGPSVLPLSDMYRRSFRLADYALPKLRALATASGECAGLYVREGQQRICLHHVQPPRSVRSHVLEGEMFPLDKGAAGRVILAIDDGVSGALYDQIRQQGFVITQKERDPESAAIACPVFANGTELLGAISLVIPFYRFTDEVVERLLPLAMLSAAELTHELGGKWPYGASTMP